LVLRCGEMVKNNSLESDNPRFQFRLHPKRDRDIIDWLLGFGDRERSVFARDALRRGMDNLGQAPRLSPKTVEAVPCSQIEESQPLLDDTKSKLDKLFNMLYGAKL
jgi:hypothetical protein